MSRGRGRQRSEAEEIAERSAVQMLGVMLADALVVMRSAEYSLDARALAQRQVRNLVTWNGGSGPLAVSAQDVEDARGSISVN